MEHIDLNVEGMKCGGCESNLKSALAACEGVASVAASHKDKTVAVVFDSGQISLERIKQVVADNGFQVV